MWQTVSVGELAALKRNALVGGPFGSNLVSADYVEEGVPVIRGQNMGQGRWIGGEFAFVSPQKAEDLSANLAIPGDLVFTQRGTLGQVALVPQGSYERYVVSQSQMKLSVNEAMACPLFLYYVFSSQEHIRYIKSNAIQTGVPHTNLGHLKATRVKLPPLEEQHSIARALGLLDDKIELNRRMNQTLGVTARAIFKAWFVDFKPIRGKHPRLANSFRESSLGLIPKEWEVGVLKDLIEDTIGGDWGEAAPSDTENEAVLCIRGADIPYLQDADPGKMPARYLSARSLTKRALRHGDLVIEISGGSPGQSTGRCVLIRQRMLDRVSYPLVCSNFCRTIRPRSAHLSGFLYFWLDWLYSRDELLQYENGTTGIKNLAFRTFSEIYQLVVPPEQMLQAFDDLTSPLLDRQQCNGVESSTLAALRDTLLPKLLSGEIRVKHAEKIVAEVV